MTGVVVDTSVIVKWFSREEDTEASLRLRDSFVKGELRIAAPDLLLIELANALRYDPAMSPEDVAAAVQSVADLGIEFEPAPPLVLIEAIAIAFRYGITVYDSVFIAMAGALGLTLVTADAKLIQRTECDARLAPLSGFAAP